MRLIAILSVVSLVDSHAQTAWSPAGTTAPPAPRAGPVMAFDEVSGSVLMFGGDGGGFPYAPFQETWLWSGAHWQRAQLAAQPQGVVNGAMAADPRRHRLVLFGGFSTNAETAQTWEWDGSTWTERMPVQTPAPRSYHAMAFDEVRGAMILFGGLGGSFAVSDTWSWDGTSWSLLSPTRAPSGRAGHVMVSDPVRRRVVLFGGYVGTGRFYTPYNDTWEWDGTNWTERVTGSPTPREGACGTFDARRGRVVIFGGFGGFPPVLWSDTWEWNGTGWMYRTTGVPSARYLAGLAYDPRRGSGVLFGGYGPAGGSIFNDTWGYGPTFPAEVQPYGQACAGSAGTPSHTALNLPWLGDTYSLRTAPLPAPALGFLFLGFDRSQWNGVPLPLDLSPLGMLGCRLELEIPLLFAAGDPGSSLTWSLPIGTTPDLLGFTFFTQSLHLDLFANPFGATTSNGLRHRIGGR